MKKDKKIIKNHKKQTQTTLRQQVVFLNENLKNQDPRNDDTLCRGQILKNFFCPFCNKLIIYRN